MTADNTLPKLNGGHSQHIPLITQVFLIAKRSKSALLSILLLLILALLAPVSYAAPIVSYPYSESFESGPGDWTTSGTLWELGTPANTVIIGASDGVSA